MVNMAGQLAEILIPMKAALLPLIGMSYRLV